MFVISFMPFSWVISIPSSTCLVHSFRKVKEAWDNKRDVLVRSGAFAIEQLSEALSASAISSKLPDGIPHDALELCAEHVRFLHEKKWFLFLF